MENDSEKHKTLYFADGNIVLLASRPDNSRIFFRVHKSVLSTHSPVFSDMFDICEPPDSTSSPGENGADEFDGLPLIHMPDNADHLASVLEILYYKRDLPQWMPRSPHYLELITPILDLSRKYGIDRMTAQIVGHLESDWPQTLSEWDKLERDVAAARNDSGSRTDDLFPEPASAIRLARQFDIPSILPAAFYHLSRISILDDWDKAHADQPISTKNPAKRTARWSVLSAKDFRCLLYGKAELHDFLRGCIDPVDLQHRTFDAPWRRESCDVGEEMWKLVLDRCLNSTDPLAQLKGPIEGYQMKHCMFCLKTLTAKIPVVRATFWEKLGDLFHIKDE